MGRPRFELNVKWRVLRPPEISKAYLAQERFSGWWDSKTGPQNSVSGPPNISTTNLRCLLKFDDMSLVSQGAGTK